MTLREENKELRRQNQKLKTVLYDFDITMANDSNEDKVSAPTITYLVFH